MASRSFNRAFRSPLTRHLATTSAPRRTLLSSLGHIRTGVIAPSNSVIGCSLQISRGLKTIDFAGHKETVYGTDDAFEEFLWLMLTM